MVWTVCFALALLLLISACAFTLVRAASKNKNLKRINPFRVITPIFFVASVILTFPAFLAENSGETAEVARAFVFSVRKAIRLVGADEIYQTVFKFIGLAPEFLRDFYQILVLAVQFFTPLFSFGLVLSFFKNFTAYIRLFLSFYRDIYVFADLNEKSLALAGDIIKNHKKARAVFAGVSEKEDSELIAGARYFGAILFKKDITAINFRLHSKKKAIYFFAMDDDEITNVNRSLDLISEYNNRENTHLYIFSTDVQSELILSGRERGAMKVRRIDEVRSLISHFLYEEGETLFESARPTESGEKQISAVIVGLGKRGSEMLKALSWYCQMDGYRVKIQAFDSDKNALERFSASCPELMSEKYNGVFVAGEAQYDISVNSGIDVTTKRFSELFMRITDATYVFVSLGSDERNVKTAVTLRMLSERMGIKPVITAVVGNSDTKAVIRSARNFAGQPYNINYIGDTESFYSERVILDSSAEEDAFKRHCAYCDGDKDKEEDFWRYEYGYRSSMASAVHAVARIKCGIAGADKRENELTDSERVTIETIEHRRWNAYMRAEGYIYSGSPERASRNDLAKMHNNLVEYSSLSDEDKRKDSRVAASVTEEE